MATTAYLIPGGGIVVDTEQDAAELMPGLGIYVEQAGAGGLSIPGFFGSTLHPTLPLLKGSNL